MARVVLLCAPLLLAASGLDLRDPAGGAAAAHRALGGRYRLHKRYDLSRPPHEEFDVVAIPDAGLTHTCANYVDDGSTVFSRDGALVLKVASACPGGRCLNSGRVMSKQAFRYGVFTFGVKVPKCNWVWPAVWLLPGGTDGHGAYGHWPCSGEIDIMESWHDMSTGAFNLVAGYSSTGGCPPDGRLTCGRCGETPYCARNTAEDDLNGSMYHVEQVDCGTGRASWGEHRFVLDWRPDRLAVYVDPTLRWDDAGNLVDIAPKPGHNGTPSFREYHHHETQEWKETDDFHRKCHGHRASGAAPFDQEMKLVFNIAVGGMQAPCHWGRMQCSGTCGGAVGSEMEFSDVSVWARVP